MDLPATHTHSRTKNSHRSSFPERSAPRESNIEACSSLCRLSRQCYILYALCSFGSSWVGHSSLGIRGYAIRLVVGMLGWIAFHVHQVSPVYRNPSTPPRLFKNHTPAADFTIIFLGLIILQAVAYFLPIFFRTLKRTSPLISGLYFSPFALAIIPFGGIAGEFISMTSLYIPLHWLGFAMNFVGTAMLSTVDQSSSRAAWVSFQILAPGGTGIMFTSTLPPTLAALQNTDVVVATGA